MATREQRLDTLQRLTLDDKLSAFLAQELEQIEAKVYRVQYADLRARRFIPLATGISPATETISYKVWDMFGEAVWAANYANGIPTVAVRAEKISSKVESILAGYAYSTKDLRAAAQSGVALETEEANAARGAIERKIDRTAALGDLARGFLGFANHPSMTLLAATASWANPATTVDQIMADLMRLAKRMRADTSEIMTPDTLLLPTDAYDALATRYLNTAGSDATILSAFIKTNPWIKNVESWPRLNAAGTGGVGRAIAYKKDADVLDLVIPLETVQYPPQVGGLNYRVPMEATFGGVRVKQPKGVLYMDGVS